MTEQLPPVCRHSQDSADTYAASGATIAFSRDFAEALNPKNFAVSFTSERI